ncbi:MAG: biotin--[acetyl-CoA-carboxylase] ligase [Hyphomicrobiales bacterium]
MNSSKFESNIEHHDVIDSTNLRAIDAILSGKKIDWITSSIQTNGKGRIDKSWSSPQGGLYATRIINSDKLNYSNLSQFSILSSVAVAMSIESFLYGKKVSLKWPNDIFLAKKKVAGILIQSINHKNRLFVIVGIGINVLRAYSESNEYSYIEDFNKDIQLDLCFESLVTNLNEMINNWGYGENFNDIKEFWLSRCNHIGKKVIVKTNNTKKEGLFKGIDKNGNLILSLDNKNELINTSNVLIEEST